jgi:hypothetical protein
LALEKVSSEGEHFPTLPLLESMPEIGSPSGCLLKTFIVSLNKSQPDKQLEKIGRL